MNEVVFSPAAVRHFKRLPAAARSLLKEVIRERLFPVTKDTDLESMLLAQRKDFWQLVDRAHKEGGRKGFTKLEDLAG